MPRKRDYQAEYKARRKRFRDLPARVASGHGEIPPYIARKLETERLSERERRLYRRQIMAYEARYGPGGAKRKPGIRQTVRGSFDTKGQAQRVGDAYGVPEEYLRVEQRGSRWRLVILR